MRGWKEILGWDGRKEESEGWEDADGWSRPVVVDEVIERPTPIPGRVDLSAQYGSYRRLPESVCRLNSHSCDMLTSGFHTNRKSMLHAQAEIPCAATC